MRLQELANLLVQKERELLDPKFEEAKKVHDWRNHVSDQVQEMWPLMGLIGRLAVYLTAEDAASREEWD